MNREEAYKKNQEGIKAYQEGKYEEARRLFNEAIGIDSEFAGAWSNRSYVYMNLGRKSEAETDNEK